MPSTMALPEAMLAPISLLGRYSIFFAVTANNQRRQFFAIRSDHAEFSRQQTQGSIAGHEKTCSTRWSASRIRRTALCVDRAAGARDPDRDDIAV